MTGEFNREEADNLVAEFYRKGLDREYSPHPEAWPKITEAGDGIIPDGATFAIGARLNSLAAQGEDTGWKFVCEMMGISLAHTMRCMANASDFDDPWLSIDVEDGMYRAQIKPQRKVSA